MYSQPATALTPALIVYLIDASDSMNERCGDSAKIDLVNKSLRTSCKRLALRAICPATLHFFDRAWAFSDLTQAPRQAPGRSRSSRHAPIQRSAK